MKGRNGSYVVCIGSRRDLTVQLRVLVLLAMRTCDPCVFLSSPGDVGLDA